ncbi:helix-turn-helix domain-containing protein [Streptomyces scabiei]|uniref:helix-turn-helix domain-containing protein n=1 Tax=Streptomyces scabiei TaxID=1930 RepID=UPI0029AB8143|nr:helix-turn-helix transcriptional regulator [Streptomyces scabiei]MDX3033010.1 helix-turn-helix transcriptional regulator [Streptomyces scabiei]
MPQPHERLDLAMNERRLKLRMSWREVAQAAGISYEALRAIRKGNYRPTELTARALDEALQWMPGSVHAVLDGGEPMTVEAQATAEQEADQRADAGATAGTPTLDQELELAARLMAAQVRELGLSPDEAAEAWRRAQERIAQSRRSSAHPRPEPLTESPRRHHAG